MWIFYSIAFLILVIGLILFIKNSQIALWEWLTSAGVAMLTAIIFHAIAFHGMTADQELWSGRIILAKQFSAWREYYEEAVYRTETREWTDSEGNSHSESYQVFDHWEPHRRWHDEHFVLYSDIATQYNVSKDEYLTTVRNFGAKTIAVRGDRTTMEHASRMIDGDPNDYETRPENGYIMPVIDQRSFVNRIKAAPTVFSYVKVGPEVPVYEYPWMQDWHKSDRVMGEAKGKINQRLWDEMSARLGPTKQVNVIIVGFGNQSIEMGMLQEAKWIGGKKNDVVICYGSSKPDKADWCHVFSWSEREDCKVNIRNVILSNKIGDNLIPLIENEIKQNFVRKDWHKFDYITISPPTWAYVTFFIVLLITQVGIWLFNFFNVADKENPSMSNRISRYGLSRSMKIKDMKFNLDFLRRR